jgi:hypothetical protein
VAFLVPNDILGRRVSFLGTLEEINITLTGTFFPIFTCGDRTNPAVDLKKTVVAFVSLQNFDGPVAGTFTFGSSPLGTDWGTGLIPTADPTVFVMPQAGALAGSGGYGPGTVFGVTLTAAATLTCDATAYGWGE